MEEKQDFLATEKVGKLMRKYAVRAFRIYLCMIILACVNKATFIFLQAMGKAVESTMLSMAREIVFGVGFALVLPCFWGLDGVLYSMPAADILTAVISAIIILKTYRQLNQTERELNPAPQKSKRLTRSAFCFL